jgi:hypothetical protein
MDDPHHWTDDDVRAHLLGEHSPLECWRVGDQGGYGFVSNSGTVFACADDWEERAIRIAAYLKKIGAQCDSSRLSDTSGSLIMVPSGGSKDEQVRVRRAAKAASV